VRTARNPFRLLRAEQRSILVASRQRIAEEHHAREWIVASGADVVPEGEDQHPFRIRRVKIVRLTPKNL
jgi:hypothetical protein